jgi:uncharacterized YccA/Bax inhibitor family protein
LFGPWAKAGAILHDQAPVRSTVVEQVSPRGPVTVIVSPVVPVPVTVGVVVAIVELATGLVMVGAVGAVVSIVIARLGDGVDSARGAAVWV